MSAAVGSRRVDQCSIMVIRLIKFASVFGVVKPAVSPASLCSNSLGPHYAAPLQVVPANLSGLRGALDRPDRATLAQGLTNSEAVELNRWILLLAAKMLQLHTEGLDFRDSASVEHGTAK